MSSRSSTSSERRARASPSSAWSSCSSRTDSRASTRPAGRTSPHSSVPEQNHSGYFDLDPNRVIDLILEFAIHNSDTDQYFKLLNDFKKEFVPQILGFKLQKYGLMKEANQRIDIDEKTPKDATQDTVPQSFTQLANPKNLVKVCAKLLKYRIIKLDEIWPHLGPSDSVFSEIYKENYSIAYTVTRGLSLSFSKRTTARN
jgi:hypothetical protein